MYDRVFNQDNKLELKLVLYTAYTAMLTNYTNIGDRYRQVRTHEEALPAHQHTFSKMQ